DTPVYDWGEVWMTRVVPVELTGVATKAPAFALSAPRPNPARGVFALELSLADGTSARVDLLDVSGRVLRSRNVDGSGSHSISFSDVGSLAPGLYCARATGGGVSRTQRVVLAR